MAYVARVTDVVRHFKASFLEGERKKKPNCFQAYSEIQE